MKENLLCLLKQPKASKCLKFWHSAIKAQTITAFSLVEMLMALLVASLLMAALAPVMTKKFSENVNVTGSMGSPASIKKTYEIEIQKIYTANNKDNKSMIIKVTDRELLEKTGGIIQGMSGSPIIQNGKFVGAVTHVLVNDPTTGYAVFADMMLKQMKTT